MGPCGVQGTGHEPSTIPDVAAALWRPQMDWLAGQPRRNLLELSVEQVATLRNQLLASDSEAVRVHAAGQLAHARGDIGLDALLEG